ncbi:ubiquitin conjugation factor core domain-containing protein [Sporobolomyces salmoneus]|uniref:ubiquitin conjugation factor core domain-containing protein n=1 Tax=Sporobolomyces salmoneus TaxID=183962 RepID=UPI003172D8B8
MSEPTPLSDAEKIRLKRIAKLQQQQQQQQASTTNTSTDNSPTPTSSAPSPRPAATPSSSKPASSTSTTPAVPKPVQITIKKSPPQSTSSSSSSTSQATSGKFTDSFEKWEATTVGNILNVTLDVEQAMKSNWQIVYLKEVAEELIAEEPSLPQPVPLKAEYTDRLILSRLSLTPDHMTEDPELVTVIASLSRDETAFQFLGGCWKRERAERYKVVLKKDSDPEEAKKRLDVLNEIKALLVSYIGLVLMDSTMFPQDHITSKPVGPFELEPLLIPSSQFPQPLPLQSSDLPSLLTDLSLRFTPSEANDHESGLDEILLPLLQRWGSILLLNKLDIGGGGNLAGTNGIGWRDILLAIQNLSEVKPIAKLMTEMRGWNPLKESEGEEGGGAVEVKAEEFEYRALWGPWLRLSSFPDGATTLPQAYFPDPTSMGQGNIQSASTSLRGTLAGLQTLLFRILSNLVRSSPSARESVLEFFASVAKLNSKRAAMRVDPRTVSTEGFIVNLHTVLLGLCEPFLDAGLTKIDKIDPLYYKYSKRIDVKEETKISATQQESDAYYSVPPTESHPAPNFITEVFFLTAQYLHIGTMHAIKEHKGISEQISHMNRQLREMEADTSWRGSPGEEQALKAIDRYKKKIEQWKSHLLCYEVQLLDPEYLAKCIGYMNLMMAWLVRLVDPKGKHPHQKIEFPLPNKTPEVFRMLPEFLIEDITEFLSFTSKYAPQALEKTPQDELMTFMLVFLSTPYMKNPYLKGQFVEIMFYLSRPTYSSPRGCLGDVLNFHALALKNLMPCLVHAYIEIESTGSHTQFYDKFNIRYYITQLFKLVWTNPTHRESLRRESLNHERYVRFVNLLMNDTTYLIDDALSHLGRITERQRLMDNEASWSSLPDTERQEKEKELRQWESAVRSDLDLGVESLRLLKLFSKETTRPFLTPEIVDRLAAMLDANLSLLAGPKCQDLKVKNPEAYKFRPKELLSDVLTIFQQLGSFEEFEKAVAKDGRSYSKGLFERAVRIARKTSIKTEEEVKEILAFVDKVEAIKLAEEEDEAMGEVPDEFLDPLTYEIMRDPVILPLSRTIIDRSSIKQHYLSDRTDPFNRQPFEWEDIVDAVELKGQIQTWLEERRKSKQKQAQGEETGEATEEKMQVD